MSGLPETFAWSHSASSADVIRTIDNGCRGDWVGDNLHGALIAHQTAHLDEDDPVPYQWQVGRFLRCAVDAGNLRAMLAIAASLRSATIRRRGAMFTRGRVTRRRAPFLYSSCVTREDRQRDLVMLCLEYSLHPDRATAMQLFHDVLAMADPRHDKFRATLFFDAFRVQLGADMVGASPLHNRISVGEFLAKADICIRDEVRFPLLHTDDGTLMCRADFVSTRLFALVVAWCLERPLDGLSHAIAAQLVDTIQIEYDGWDQAERDEHAPFNSQLCNFIDLHWPVLRLPPPGAPGTRATLNATQTGVVRAMAECLARHSLGTSHVIPHILDYIRVPNASEARFYRQIEAQTAHAAFGRAQLAHAATAATSKGPAPASAPTHKRARAEEEDEKE